MQSRNQLLRKRGSGYSVTGASQDSAGARAKTSPANQSPRPRFLETKKKASKAPVITEKIIDKDNFNFAISQLKTAVQFNNKRFEVNNDLRSGLAQVLEKNKKRSRQNVFHSQNSERQKIIEVKRRLTLGDGLRLIPTSDFEIEQIKKANAERRGTESGKKENISKNANLINAVKQMVSIKMGATKP